MNAGAAANAGIKLFLISVMANIKKFNLAQKTLSGGQ
jgi:hypothetical protein